MSERFKWEDGYSGEYRFLRDTYRTWEEGACGGYHIKGDGYYPYHYKKRCDTEEKAIEICEKYLVGRLKGEIKSLEKEIKRLTNK